MKTHKLYITIVVLKVPVSLQCGFKNNFNFVIINYNEAVQLLPRNDLTYPNK